MWADSQDDSQGVQYAGRKEVYEPYSNSQMRKWRRWAVAGWFVAFVMSVAWLTK